MEKQGNKGILLQLVYFILPMTISSSVLQQFSISLVPKLFQEEKGPGMHCLRKHIYHIASSARLSGVHTCLHQACMCVCQHVDLTGTHRWVMKVVNTHLVWDRSMLFSPNFYLQPDDHIRCYNDLVVGHLISITYISV